MVSSLTSRLLADYNRSTESTNDPSRNQHPQLHGNSISSGYSADKEADSVVGLPPVLIDLHKRKLSCEQERTKRRKLSEKNYAASTVAEDLDNAGLPVPPVNRLRPRLSPLIDISKVTLLSSKAVKDSPFLYSMNVDYDVMTDFGNVYQDLMTQTAPMYAGSPVCKEQPVQSDAEDTKSTCSTSSMSDNGSDTSMTPSASSLLVIHARLDDTFEQERQEASESQASQSAASFAVQPPTNLSFSLEDAVGICQHARLVTSSATPNRVIFANAAFSALTGLRSDETLGRPLNELLNPGKGKLCLESLATQDCVETSVLSKAETTVQSSMTVTPVLSTLTNNPTKSVTHFAVDLSNVGDESALDNANRYDSGAFSYTQFQVIA